MCLASGRTKRDGSPICTPRIPSSKRLHTHCVSSKGPLKLGHWIWTLVLQQSRPSCIRQSIGLHVTLIQNVFMPCLHTHADIFRFTRKTNFEKMLMLCLVIFFLTIYSWKIHANIHNIILKCIVFGLMWIVFN